MKYKSDFATTRFRELLDAWKEQQKANNKPHSNYEFAKQVNEQERQLRGDLATCRVDYRNVSKWYNGTNPEKYIEEISRVFGVPVSSFSPQSHDERYSDSSEFITELGKEHVEFAKEIGLDLELTRALTRVVDFDDLFPLYAPINHAYMGTIDGDPTGSVYKMWDRKVNYMNSAVIDKDLSFLQIERDGKRITLHKGDIAFLKEVQDKVVDYVRYLFFARTEEMRTETDRFNKDRYPIETTEKGETCISTVPIDKQFVLDHDRFARYTYNFEEPEDNPTEDK